MNNEIEQLKKNNTWIMVDRPKNRKVLKNLWIYRTKKDHNGNIVKYKARLCLKGYLQVFGLDYTETFAPVIKIPSIRIILILTNLWNLKLFQVDFDGAFLNAPLQEDIYMEQPMV